MSTVHVVPERDRIRHTHDGADCPCRPTTEPVPRADGRYGWLVIHNAIDGRREHRPSKARNILTGLAVRTSVHLSGGVRAWVPRHWACHREDEA